MPALDLTWVRMFSSRDVRGIVGMNVLATRALRIDFDAGKLSFLRQATRKAGEAELPLYNRSIELDPNDARTFCKRAAAREDQDDILGAVADWKEAIRLDPSKPRVHAQLAWIYATCWNGDVRDGELAVELAKKVCEMSGWNHARCLWTLAVAYAEAADFSNAILCEEQALEYADETEKPFCEYCLDLFKSGTPYHAEPPTQSDQLKLTASPCREP